MKKWISAILAVLMAAGLTACSSRHIPDTPQEKPAEPPKEEQPQQPETPEPSKPEEPKPEPVPEPEPETEPEKEKEPEEPQASPASVTDFSAYASLDGSKKQWGPGGPVDEWNRSQGALLYQELYGKYNADFIRENEKKIYLTFDEGYENGFTGKILDVLKEKNCPAVFFVTGPYAKSQPELIQRMIDEGHIVGNHSVHHPSFPETPIEQCKEEVAELHDYMKENFGYNMNLFRFPMGEFSEQTLKLMQDMGYRSVFWSFAYRDWSVDEQLPLQEAKDKILSKVHPGAIYLLHAVSETNAAVLGDVIDEFRAQGYELAPYRGNFNSSED